jgi:anti-anti-sigma factor
MQSLITRSQSTVIQFRGNLNAANAADVRSQLADAVLSEHHAGLVVDMANVESIDSAGLMALVSALALSQRLNKRLALCTVPYPVKMILELTQLDKVFEVFDDRTAFESAA